MRSTLVILGAILLLLGIVGLAIPVFTTHQTEDVAKIGALKVQATQNTAHVIPPILSGGVLAVGIVLMGAGFYQARKVNF